MIVTAKTVSGVVRLTYRVDGKIVGTARLVSTTIGDIFVNKPQQRKGYGKAILEDMIQRGGRFAIAVSEGGRRLLIGRGFTERQPGYFYLGSR